MSEEPEGYKFIKTIGKGSFGEVYLTSKKGTSQLFATKKMDKSFVLQEKVKKYFNNEIFILKQVNHRNIIKLEEVKTGINCFFLIFELCNGGSLAECLEQYKKDHNGAPFTQEIVQYLMRQIICGFAYLHDMKVLHRDIKLDNILVQYPTEEDKQKMNLLKCELKIIDFGFARYLQAESLAKSLLGNPINMDPHILKKLNKMDNSRKFGYDQKADIWSLGTICYEMLIGTPAFDASSMDELTEKIDKGNYKIPHDITVSREVIAFLNGMMQYDPSKRLNIHELASQFFLTNDISTFHPLRLQKANMSLGQSIMLNCKENNSFLCAFDKIEDINPRESMGPHSIYQKQRTDGIQGEPVDVISNLEFQHKKEIEIQRAENNNYIIHTTSSKGAKIEPGLSDFLHDLFDKMNKDTFYIEPLLIPIQPSDSLGNVDPISKFIDNI